MTQCEMCPVGLVQSLEKIPRFSQTALMPLRKHLDFMEGEDWKGVKAHQSQLLPGRSPHPASAFVRSSLSQGHPISVPTGSSVHRHGLLPISNNSTF